MTAIMALGSGKSTLLRALICWEPPQWRDSFQGRTSADCMEKHLRHAAAVFGMVFQGAQTWSSV